VAILPGEDWIGDIRGGRFDHFWKNSVFGEHFADNQKIVAADNAFHGSHETGPEINNWFQHGLFPPFPVLTSLVAAYNFGQG